MKKYLTSRLAMLAMSGGRSTFQKSRSFCAVTVDSSSALSSNICRGEVTVFSRVIMKLQNSRRFVSSSIH